MYKQPKLMAGQTKVSCIIRVSDNAFIPLKPDNTDYQAYLEWVAEGNQPEAADE